MAISLLIETIKNLLTKEGRIMMYTALAINIINEKMKFSSIKSKAVQAKVKEQLELLVTNEETLKELLSK